MDRIKRIGPYPTPRLVIDNTGKSQEPPSKISPRRQQQLREALQALASELTSPAYFAPLVDKYIPIILPGKRVARVDMLKTENSRTFSRYSISTPRTYAFSNMEITPLMQRNWSQLSVTGDPEFRAAMQAINQGVEVVIREGGETFLARPLLGAEETKLGAIVLSNRTSDGVSLVTIEDQEIFQLFAQEVSRL